VAVAEVVLAQQEQTGVPPLEVMVVMDLHLLSMELQLFAVVVAVALKTQILV
jgi:hypothetical protein